MAYNYKNIIESKNIDTNVNKAIPKLEAIKKSAHANASPYADEISKIINSSVSAMKEDPNNFSLSNVIGQIQSVNDVNTVVSVNNSYLVFSGRQDLVFEYEHNAENTRRLDPAATNLIDTFILTRAYDESYRNYVYDNTNTVAKPANLDSVQLNSSYSGLFNYKMLSDEMVLNPGIYKLLFGAKADVTLQANFQIIKNANTTLSDTEIKSRVVDSINSYFSLDNWDFGNTFYFSELAAYLHQQLSSYISSVVLIPIGSNNYFGSLYEIRCEPNEIFLSAATVDNIQIVQSVLSGINSAGVQLYQGY